MSLPIDLVLVRHGESEGNVATRRSKKGDHSAFRGKFKNRIGAMLRLTDEGKKQAGSAGLWIREHIGERFDRYYVSEYLRAKETAAILCLPDALWFCDFYLRERDWGDMESKSEAQRKKLFAKSLKRREIDGFYWTPPNGESLAQLCLRIDRVLNTWHRECGDKQVIAVCHGEVMWAFRVRLERMSQERFRELDTSKNPHHRIHNCQILHYTRRHPEFKTISPYYSWMRSVCPTDVRLSENEWQKIHRKAFTNNELREQVEKTPRILNS